MAALATSQEPNPVRVMLVDDSAVVRGFVSRWIAAEPGFKVVGAATNGNQALSLLDVLRPDIVLLDLDMPELDGLATLPQLMARRPDLSVVVVSTLTRRNAEISLQCLARGAVDYIPKPESRLDLASPTMFRDELLLKLAGLASRHRASAQERVQPPRPATARAPRVGSRPRVLALGASTGGPQALSLVLRGLARVSEQVPILVVQHMPEVFTAVFAEQLRDATGLAVAEATDGEAVRPGRVYLAPGGRHMGLEASQNAPPVIRLDTRPPVHHCRPAVDVLFADVAKVFGAAALGVVLTGMGSDGTDGARQLVRAGAAILVQDEPTSTVWGMPGSIAQAGLAREVLPLPAIARAVERAILRAP